jgi:hypothetical protein
MIGRIAARPHGVTRLGNHGIAARDHSANRHFAGLGRNFGELERTAHGFGKRKGHGGRS